MSMIEMHRLMLRDDCRNSAYERAIRALVRPGDRVLDLGAGTGLLSMMAARAGAESVVAVEAAGIASVGKALCKHNKLDRRIIWKTLPSTELSLKQKATVLITETFGSHPFEECAHEFVRDARERLCTPDVRVIPGRVRVYGAPAQLLAQRDDWDLFARPIAGFSFTPLRADTLSAMYAERIPHDALLAPGTLLEDVALGGSTPSRRKLEASWLVQKKGVVSGITQWYSLELAPGITLSTAPDAAPTHWRQIFYPCDRNIPVIAGQRVNLALSLDTRIEVPLRVQWKIDVSAA